MHLPVLWALGFGALPILQFGIAATALPILIHLLNRRKYREMRWAAMRFLIAAMRKNQRRVKVEQWLLLAIRTLVILLVVSAMAKPFLESMGAIALPGQRTHRVLVLDGSLSMAYSTADKTRFDQAKALAAQLVRDTRRGDVLSIVLMADPPRIVVGDASPSANQAEVLKEIESINLPHGGTDLVASFGAIDRVLEVSTIPRKEVIFLTDLQAASWRRPESGGEALKSATAKLAARRAQSVVIDLGVDGGENRAVTDLRLDAPVVTLNGPAPKLIATVRNFGPNVTSNVKARLLIDGQLGPDQSVPEIAVGGDATFVFTPGFATPGDHLVEVRIDDDPLMLDNKRRIALPVREFLNVLLVDGHPKAEPFQAETDYLTQALNPEAKSAGSPSQIRTEVVNESQLGNRDLAPFDAVVLCNIAQFTGAEVSSLDAYLKQGGGVVLFGGDQVIPENYNQLLFADGKGMLPAMMTGVVGDAQARRSAFEFDAGDFKHPIVNAFAGAAANVIAGLTGAKTWQYHRLKIPEDRRSMARVALSFDSGDPAIIEMPHHRGTVIQVATSADTGWSTWPLHQSYPPIMEQVILQAASGRLSERNVRVGQPFDQALPAAVAGTSVEITRPDDAPASVKLQTAGDVSLLHYEDTDLSGAYRAKFGPPMATESIFAANPDPIESDPLKLDRSGLKDAVPGWDFTYLTNWKDLTGNASSVGRRGELHRPLLYALLVMLMVESFAAWKFGHH
ncbi:BatA domain-containing protein [Tundrisphaera lichenicola]|uniref:BatA domain-containing protein n=1 Tax=Tundrisphaera lichenicola TaxID=2029860 RepID=UPI003EC05402